MINALFYENCIEDTESVPTLNYNYVNACNDDDDTAVHMLLYAKAYGDELYGKLNLQMYMHSLNVQF